MFFSNGETDDRIYQNLKVNFQKGISLWRPVNFEKQMLFDEQRTSKKWFSLTISEFWKRKFVCWKRNFQKGIRFVEKEISKKEFGLLKKEFRKRNSVCWKRNFEKGIRFVEKGISKKEFRLNERGILTKDFYFLSKTKNSTKLVLYATVKLIRPLSITTTLSKTKVFCA